MANYELKEICNRFAAAATEAEMDRCRDEMVEALDAGGEYAEFQDAMYDAAFAKEGNDDDIAIRRRFRDVLRPVKASDVEARPLQMWLSEPDPPPVLWRDIEKERDGVDSVAAVGEIATLSGAGRSGKSFMALALAIEAVKARRSGTEYGTACGLRVRAGPAVFVSYEDSPKRVSMRASAMGSEQGVLAIPYPPALYGYSRQSRSWARTPAWRPLWDAIHAAEPVLVVIDTGPRAMGGETMDPGAVIGFLQALEREARTGANRPAVLVLAHDTKAARDAARSGAELDAGAVFGSGQWHDAPRGVLHLTKTGPGDADRILEAVKCSYGGDGWGAILTPAYNDSGGYAGLEFGQGLNETEMREQRAALKTAREQQRKTTSAGNLTPEQRQRRRVEALKDKV